MTRIGWERRSTVESNMVGDNGYLYEVNESWAEIPRDWDAPMSAIAVDSQDRIYGFNRGEHPLIVFDKNGKYLTSWGEGLFNNAHSVRTDTDDNVWVSDRYHGQIMKFTPDGKLLLTIGEKGSRSDTGLDPNDWSSVGYRSVTHGGPPFNQPCGLAFSESGDLFIADGYGNARVHRFSPEGELRLSWGEPGTGQGQFNLPHDVWVDSRGRVLVADRENNRVQCFTPDGRFQSVWPTELIGPAAIAVDADDIVYIPEHNSGHFSILNLDGESLARWGGDVHKSCHGVAVDSHRDLYFVQPPAGGGSRVIVKYRRK